MERVIHCMKQVALYKNGECLSYAEYGNKNGFPILIQHGLIASIKDYDLFDRLIQLGARLICIARPGYGASSPYLLQNMAEWAEIVTVLIDELQLSQFDVLGMSSGAPYSYALGYRFPQKVRSIYIFSGIPALYDEKIASCWPHEIKKNADITEMQSLAKELFFPGLSEEDLKKNDIKDSMMNDCFGIAQDLRIRCMDWGFHLSDVIASVFMRHSRYDQGVPVVTAELTARMLPNCSFEAIENDVHFSVEALDDFIVTVIAKQSLLS